jgi:hypothetical protein
MAAAGPRECAISTGHPSMFRLVTATLIYHGSKYFPAARLPVIHAIATAVNSAKLHSHLLPVE